MREEKFIMPGFYCTCRQYIISLLCHKPIKLMTSDLIPAQSSAIVPDTHRYQVDMSLSMNPSNRTNNATDVLSVLEIIL